MEKQCFKCGLTQPIEFFYRHPQMADGHLNKCKACAKRDVAARYENDREKVVAYEKARFQTAHRKAKVKEYFQRYRLRYPEKMKARRKINNAKRDKKLFSQPCVHCGCSKTQAHHTDYSKPFDVTWMCFACHRIHGHGQTVTATA